ncbi:PGF-pre-PGF domain-containing protein [Candidatus Woesearchaeota archaeon]|nr:PGF-pre-PGF domain-containing protein [Candidatus Woesearchaeota archaeon]
MKKIFAFIVITLLLVSIALAAFGPSKPASSTSTSSSSSSSSSSSGGGSSSSGSGVAGAAGGVATGVEGQFASKAWTSINAGETASVVVADDALGVTEVSFAVDKTTYGSTIRVGTEVGLPSAIAPVSTKVYKIVKITASNIENSLKGTVTIKFKVEKTWLEGQKLKKDDIALLRFSEQKWNQLSTTVGEEDEKYVHYSAETPGFSYFVIGQRMVVAAEEIKTPVEQAPISGAATESSVPETGGESKTTPLNKLWWVPVLVAIVLGVLFYWYSKKKQ